MKSGKKSGGTVSVARAIAEPIAQELGLIIWDVRYEKEGGSWYLRVFIDKPGGVTIEDCENLSRRIDGPLDEADPTEGSYFLEVSSPGIERELVRPEHFQAYLGQEVEARLIRPDGASGEREFRGTLAGYEDGTVLLETEGGPRSFDKKQIARVRVCEDY